MIFDSGGTWRLLRSGGDFVFAFQSAAGGRVPYKTARFNSTFTAGEVLLCRDYFKRHGLDAVYPLQFPLDELLMVHLLSRGRGMEIHGAALLDDAIVPFHVPAMFTGVPTDTADGAVALLPHAAMLTAKRTISATCMSIVCRRSRFCSSPASPQRESLLFRAMTAESQAPCHRQARGCERGCFRIA